VTGPSPLYQEVIPIVDRRQDPQDPHPREQGDPALPAGAEVTDAIAHDILKIHEEAYGRGARVAHAELVGDFVIVVLDHLDLLPNEEFLVENGQRDAVAQVRTRYQAAIQAPFRAAVERATGRKVVGFQSTTNVEEPPFMVEIFRLG
jgi:uncharacterized protein YbcI